MSSLYLGRRSGFRSKGLSGPDEDGALPKLICIFSAAGSKIIVCRVYLPWLTASICLATSASVHFSLPKLFSNVSQRGHFSPVDSSFERKWLVQATRPLSAGRATTLLDVTSSTTPLLGSHRVTLHMVVRGVARISFSASATVLHSSSTRRKVDIIGWPLGSKRGEPSPAVTISLTARHRPASFMPVGWPIRPG